MNEAEPATGSAQTINKVPIFEKKIGTLLLVKRENTRNYWVSGHDQPFNVLCCGGQEALFAHVLNSKHTGIT